MPTYQYACTDCGHRFEAVQAFTDGSLTECPECGGKLRKVYGSVGVVFKGSGFYRNDARNGASDNGKKDAAVSGDGGGSTSGESSGAKKDSAPAASGSDAATKPAAKEKATSSASASTSSSSTNKAATA